MAGKKTNKFLVFGLYMLVGVVLSVFIALFITSLLNFQTVNLTSLIESFSADNFFTFFVISLGGIFVYSAITVSSSKDGDTEMKGKDKMENQHFMVMSEIDKTFPSCLFTNLRNYESETIPIRAEFKNGKVTAHFAPAEAHMLIIGSTGVGKTTAFLEPVIQIMSELKNKPSFFITDPKGELYSRHSLKLKQDGYRVICLDFIEPYNSVQWNPLEMVYNNYQKALHLEEEILKHLNDDVKKYNFIQVGEINNMEWYEFESKAFGSLRDALTEVEVARAKLRDDCYDDLNDIASAISPVTSTKDPTWENGARDYILSVLIAMLEDSENPALGMTVERFNFYNMYKICMNKEKDMEYVKEYFSGRSPLSKTVQLASHIIHSNAKTTRDSYMSSVNNKLSLFADNGICFLTAKNDVDFTTFDEQPTAFFIKIPDERETRYSLASICFSQSYKAFVRKARINEIKYNKASLKRPLFYLLDEFANMPPINNFNKIITVARSRRIYLNLIIQSYSQLENSYGKETANTIMGNCTGTVFLGTPDLHTREEFSKSLGNYTIKVESKGKGKGADGKESPTTNTSLQTVPLVYPSDLDKLPMGEPIVSIFRCFPMKSKITPYFQVKGVYKIGKMETPFILGRRLNEEAVFYDIKHRNSIVLDYD